MKEVGGDYLWIVKENQPSLLTDLEVLFGSEPTPPGGSPYPTDFSCVRSVDKSHGRLEERKITVSSLLKGYSLRSYLKQAFKLERWRTDGTGKTPYEVR